MENWTQIVFFGRQNRASRIVSKHVVEGRWLSTLINPVLSRERTARMVRNHAGLLDRDQAIANIEHTCAIGTLYIIVNLRYDAAGLPSFLPSHGPKRS